MNNFLNILALVTLFLGTTLTSNAQDKVGYVNVNEIAAKLPAMKTAQANLKVFEQQLSKQLESKSTALQTKYSKLIQDAQGGTVARVDLERREAEIVKEQQALVQEEKKLSQQLKNRAEEQMKPIQDKIQNAIDSVAKENGYTFVLDSSLGVILYGESSTDLTPKVKSKLGITN